MVSHGYETAQGTRMAPNGNDGHRFDGFVSYSHAADGLLAPRLQAGLQRFAKPWWKRRALRIFRDESSLSANPHLWASITEALDSSGWFILLLSPEAAQSQWVNQEIEYWKTHRDPTRILPVVTDGVLAWTHDRIVGNAVPPALDGVFDDEPRWVDLRWAKGETQLDKKDPRFADAVADIASTIRNIPKDDLASEEVRHHRRTVRTAWLGASLIGVLAVASVGFGINAADERDRANSEASRANTFAEQEASARAEADSNAVQAAANAEEAATQAAVARSREMAAAATTALTEDPERAMLLAIRSMQVTPSGEPISIETIRALRLAVRDNRLETRIEGANEGFQRFAVAPGGTRLYTIERSDESVTAIDLRSGAVEWRASLGADPQHASIAVSPDGGLLAVGFENDGDPAQLFVFAAESGERTDVVIPGECHVIGFGDRAFSADGTTFAVTTGGPGCLNDPENLWAALFETATWTEVAKVQRPGMWEAVDFAWARDRVLLQDLRGQRGPQVLSWPDLDLVREFETGPDVQFAAIDPSGTRIAFREGRLAPHKLFDIDTGDFLGYFESQGPFSTGPGVVFSPTGDLAVATTRTRDVVVDAGTGQLVLELGTSGTTVWAAFTPDGLELITRDVGGDILVWKLDQFASEPLIGGDNPAYWVNPGKLIDGPSAAALVLGSHFRLDFWLHVFDEETAETLSSVQAVSAAQLPDGRFVIVPLEYGDVVETGAFAGQPDLIASGLSLWDPESGTLTPITDCSIHLSSIPERDPTTPTGLCPNGEPVFAIQNPAEDYILVSDDGASFAAVSHISPAAFEGLSSESRQIRVWDSTSMEELARLEVPGAFKPLALGKAWVMGHATDTADLDVVVYDLSGKLIGEIPGPVAEWENDTTRTGSYLFSSILGRVAVIDMTAWSVNHQWPAHEGVIRSVVLSPDETRLATTGEDGVVRIWDVRAVLDGTGEEVLLDELPVGVASDVRWMDGDRLGVAIREGRWTVAELDPAALMRQALARSTRGFTATECATYRLDPCPTLEELRGG